MTDPKEPESIPVTSIRVVTPDGTMFVHIGEYDGGPKKVWLHIGKAGTSLSTWTDALGRVISLALRNGVKLSDVVEEISNIKTSRTRKAANGAYISSGPDGLAHGLLSYAASKRKDEDEGYRPARLNG